MPLVPTVSPPPASLPDLPPWSGKMTGRMLPDSPAATSTPTRSMNAALVTQQGSGRGARVTCKPASSISLHRHAVGLHGYLQPARRNPDAGRQRVDHLFALAVSHD